MRSARTTLGLALVIIGITSFGFPEAGSAAVRTPSDKFVRLANDYLKAGRALPSSEYARLAS